MMMMMRIEIEDDVRIKGLVFSLLAKPVYGIWQHFQRAKSQPNPAYTAEPRFY
jgi:hypothetical protein